MCLFIQFYLFVGNKLFLTNNMPSLPKKGVSGKVFCIVVGHAKKKNDITTDMQIVLQGFVSLIHSLYKAVKQQHMKYS